MADWGVPDWRDGAAYPPKLSQSQWWWEFTRRRPDYRSLWQDWSTRIPSWHESDPKRIPTDDSHGLRLKYKMSLLLDPTSSHCGLTVSAHFFGPNAATPPLTRSRLSGLEEMKWLIENVNPEFADLAIEEEKQKADAAEAQGIKLYQFDLSLPLEPQLKKAEQQLRFAQEHEFGCRNTRKPRRDNWPLFLRAIDARDDSATFEEMRLAFWPRLEGKTAQSARDTYKAACELRDNFPI